jgi:hypothetical protein
MDKIISNLLQLGGKCSTGEILKKGYVTKNNAIVKSTCIIDKGNPGKGPNILPKIGDEISLRQYNYSLKNKDVDRQKALIRASKKETTLLVLKHLVLISNYSKSEKSNYEKYRNDIAFLKKLYKYQKKN